MKNSLSDPVAPIASDSPGLRPSKQTTKPRLSRYRKSLGLKNSSLDDILNAYSEWVNYSEWLVFRGINQVYGYYTEPIEWFEKTTVLNEKGKPTRFHRFHKRRIEGIYIPEDVKYKVSKASKRGNDIYRWRLNKRLKILEKAKPLTIGYHLRGYARKISKALFVTLTYHHGISLYEAWKDVGIHYNRWINRIRGKYGDVGVIRCWEAHKGSKKNNYIHRGYPHIHVLLLFHDAEFTVFRHKSKWRIDEKQDFEWEWGWVDVQAMESIAKGIKYVLKYLTKIHGSTINNLTLAITWFYRKRSWSMSRRLSDLIKAMRNSNHEEAAPIYLWKLLGFYGGRLPIVSTLLEFWEGQGMVGWSLEVSSASFWGMFGSETWNDYVRKKKKPDVFEDYDQLG